MARFDGKERIDPIIVPMIPYPGLVKIETIGDGSCLFHAILRAYGLDYFNTKNIHARQLYAKQLRHELADLLIKINPYTGRSYYDSLHNGTLREFSENVKEYSLYNMYNELRSNSAVGNVYHELISNYLNLDIYLIDILKGDVYPTTSDLNCLYKNRNSIFIAVVPGHFEVIGVKDACGSIGTHFGQHPFVDTVRKRLEVVVKSKIEYQPEVCIGRSPDITPPQLQLTPPQLQLTPPQLQLTPPQLQLTPPQLQLTPPQLQLTPPHFSTYVSWVPSQSSTYVSWLPQYSH